MWSVNPEELRSSPIHIAIIHCWEHNYQSRHQNNTDSSTSSVPNYKIMDYAIYGYIDGCSHVQDIYITTLLLSDVARKTV